MWTFSLDRHSNCLLSSHRERMNLKAPIYFSTGLTEKANHYYKLFITWTNQKIRKTFVQRNMFEFKHIKPFDRSYADNPGPMVSICSLRTVQMVKKFLALKIGTTVNYINVCDFRWCLPLQVCCMLVSLCRSSKNGQATRKTWWASAVCKICFKVISTV